jgi:hypothetical protein
MTSRSCKHQSKKTRYKKSTHSGVTLLEFWICRNSRKGSRKLLVKLTPLSGTHQAKQTEKDYRLSRSSKWWNMAGREPYRSGVRPSYVSEPRGERGEGSAKRSTHTRAAFRQQLPTQAWLCRPQRSNALHQFVERAGIKQQNASLSAPVT